VRAKIIITGLLFLTLLVPVGGQRPGAYFSVSTNKTFLPGEKIGVHLYATDVAALEFRVYKIKDPAAFLEKLDSPHNFGHVSETEQIETPTLIERFHDWKKEIWRTVRDFFREQFSSRSRAQIREKQGEALKSKAGEAAVFAQVPVLNSSQLVARWRQEMPPRYLSESISVPITSLAKGMYLLEATDGNLRAYTLVIVSELGVITKTAPGQVLTFSANRNTGEPVPGTDVRVWSDKKENVRLKSDASGLAESSLPAGQYEDVRVVAIHGDDVALATPESYNLSSKPDQDLTAYVYTDRPVYRPTHTVHFKAILRAYSGEHYKVPSGDKVQVLIEDPASKIMLQNDFPASSFGTIHGDLELPLDAALGYYSITVRWHGTDGSQGTGGFHVEEYKKPEYEVRVSPSTLRILQGNSIDATIDAHYFFGEPVAGADVKYIVHTSDYWSPFIDHDDDNDLSSGGGESETDQNDEYDYAGEQISEQSGKLDQNGRLKVHIPTKLDGHHHDMRYRIEARVTDAGNREISGHNSVIATYGSFAVGISPDNYFFQKGEKMNATVVAKDYDGKPIQTRVRVETVKYNYTSGHTNETVLDSVLSETGADGTARVSLTAKDSGGLTLRVSATTPENREVSGIDWIWVAGAGEADWGVGENKEIRLVADKKSYQVGETAHVLAMTGIPESYLLVTTEARTIQSKRVIHATSSTPTIDIPILSDHQPNVFVSVSFLHENSFYESSKNIKVPAVQQALKIEIQPSKKQFAPGQDATYTILAHDSQGKPVAGEFSVGVVDEAIYGIYPDTSGDINSAFFGPVYDRVSTDSSMRFYFSGEAGKKEMFLTYRAPTNPRALAQLKPEPLVQAKVRKLFPDTALWLADVHTDSSGRAEAKLTFPDSLTSWRTTVRGATVDTRVGSAINNVIVRKNVMVRLAVPRFFRQGDEVTISAIVHNYLATAKDVHVSLDVKGLEILSGATTVINVPSKGEAKADWRVRAQSTLSAVLDAKALTNEESDALEITLPIIPAGVKQTDAKSGSIVAADQDETETITLPGNPSVASPSLDISLNSSLAGSIFGALDYLTAYPYGCTEQTMSSFLPNVVVAKAMKDLHISSTANAGDLDSKIKAGMARLQDFQHDDGGWGWWKDDESQVFMTAYVVAGFGQVRDAGYQVNADSLGNAQKWLHNSLANHANMRPDLQAFVVYALALIQEAHDNEIEAAWNKRSSMTTQGLAMLGLTQNAKGNHARAKEIADKLESTAITTDREASWPENYDYFMEFEIDDAAETTAYAVRLLSLEKPESPLLPKAAFWLVNHRDGGYFWDSTKQTAMVIFGLTEYMKTSHELDANFHAEVFVNGKQVSARQFTAADSFNPTQPTIHLDASALHEGANEIRIHKTGAGRLYWSASGSYYSNDKKLVQSNKLSLNITRDYFRLTPENTGNKIVYNLDPLQGDLHVGDVLAVRVTVGGSEWRYLLMEDPIPAGAEFITRDDLYELKQKPGWWDSWFTRREFHDDRAAIFQTYFNKHQQYVYLLKIVNPGKFQVSPALVRPMYQPSIFATSDALLLEVK
jgi:alpha-2-macroglobulin